MAQLRKEIKLFIVRSLAVFNTPKETVDAVNEEFKIKVSPQQCERYDPTKRAGKDLSKDLVNEFNETRKLFTENIQSIPVANKVYRLQKIQNMINSSGKNNMLVLQALEQAAKEVGDVFSNKIKQEIGGKDGKPIPIELSSKKDPIEAARAYSDLMQGK